MQIELVYERPTKRTVRFCNEDFGTVYVPNERFEQLGRPERIVMTLEAAAAPVALQAA